MEVNELDPKRGAAVVAVLLLVVISGIVFLMAYEQVPEGHVGVKKSWGEVTGQTYDPGAHIKMPIKDSVYQLEIRPRTYKSSVDVTTLNGTTFNVKYVIRYRVNKQESAAFVTQWNTISQAEKRLIDPTVEDRMRKEGAGIRSSIIFTKTGRSRLTQAVRDKLKTEFADEAMRLEAVQITNVGIPERYQKALNKKEIAKQQVQQEQYNVQKEKKIAKQKRIQAKADADVIRIKGNALQNNSVVLRQRWIDSIDSTDKVIIGQGSNGVIIDATGDATNATSNTSETTTRGSETTEQQSDS